MDKGRKIDLKQQINLMTDLTQFFNFSRPPNGTYQQQSLGTHAPGGPQQASFDINEFPSLSKMSLLSQMQASSRANYVNIAKDNATQLNQSSSLDQAQSEFTISSEDFPALPGSNNPNVSIIGTKSSTTTNNTTMNNDNDDPSSLTSTGAINKSSSSTTTSALVNNNFNNTMINPTSPTNLNNSTSSNSNNNSGLIGCLGNGNNSTISSHDMIGATAAIDQCAREKSYFSPLVPTPQQKSMWMNGPVDRSNLLSSPATAASVLELSKKHQLQLEEQQQHIPRFGRADGLNDYPISGNASDLYKASNEPLSPSKDGLKNSNSATTPTNGGNPSTIIGSKTGPGSLGVNNNIKNQNSNNIGGSSSGSNIGKGVQISGDGRVTNIPSSMVTDQFGMIGLLAFLRAAETDPNLASVTFGTDLTALGLNLTAAEKLYPSFAGPWTDQPLKVYEIDYPVPSEYSVNSSIRDKLTQITLKRYHEDTIFFLFYMFPNDMLQIAAAIELYSREWRYHKEEKVWITRAAGIAPSEKTNSYERGTYFIFDALLWRRVAREFLLEYDRLESKPTI